MHELSLCEGMLAIVDKKAAEENFKRVTILRLEIGELSHVEPEAMKFCFDSVAKNTILEGAVLEIILSPGRGVCRECKTTSNIQHLYEACPCCGQFGLEITSGMDIRIQSMDVM